MKASKLYINDFGKEKCVFCNSDCSKKILVSSFIKKTFTNYDLLQNPDGLYMCKGCYFSMTDKSIEELIMPDGEIKTNQSARTYSWVLTKKKKRAFSKRHIKEIKEIVLNPPKPPFAIVISDKGKKHLIFRSLVSYSRDDYVLQFEEESVFVNVKKLKDRIELCERIIAFCGKINILKYSKFKISKHSLPNVSESLLNQFFSIKEEKLMELAIFLSKNKKECYNEYYFIEKSKRIQTENSGFILFDE